MLGTLFALGAAASFATQSVVIRRGVRFASVDYLANISIFSGLLFFLLISILTGDLFRLGEFNWKVYALFTFSGVIHFVLGRTFGFRCIQYVGSTRSNVITGLHTIVSILLAIVVLRENLTPITTLGVLLALSGPVLIASKEHTAAKAVSSTASHGSKDVDRRTLYVGMLYGAGAALFWGSSAIFIKIGLDNGGTSIGGSLMAYAAASIAISHVLVNRNGREEIFNSDVRTMRLGVAIGMATNIGQMQRFLALGHAPVIIVSLMMTTQPVWVLLFSFLFNRKYESFSRWVFLGNSLVLAGTILVIL